MVGGTIFHREMIPREISRALVLNLSGETSGAKTPPRRSLPLTEPSLLSRATRLRCALDERGGRGPSTPQELHFVKFLLRSG